MIGGERRMMAAPLLPDRRAEVVHDHMVIGAGEMVLCPGPKLADGALLRMMHRDLHGLRRQQGGELVQREAVVPDRRPGHHGLRAGIEHVGLRERPVRGEFGHFGRGNLQRVEHHGHARDAAKGPVFLGHEVAGEPKIGLPGLGLHEQFLALLRPKVDQLGRERVLPGRRRGGNEQAQRGVSADRNGHDTLTREMRDATGGPARRTLPPLLGCLHTGSESNLG